MSWAIEWEKYIPEADTVYCIGRTEEVIKLKDGDFLGEDCIFIMSRDVGDPTPKDLNECEWCLLPVGISTYSFRTFIPALAELLIQAMEEYE